MSKRKNKFHKKLERSRYKNIPVGEKVAQEEWDKIFGKKTEVKNGFKRNISD